MNTEDYCELCGFDPALYSVESDTLSTAALAPDIVADAAAGLSSEQRSDSSVGGSSIDDLITSVDNFAGDPLETAHHGLHTVAEIGAIRAAIGAGPRPGNGEVTGLHLSNGGVPKTAVELVDVTASGVAGDVQNNRIHHGRPLQALCLWSADVIAALNEEGHPITPGVAGENITVSGIDWASLGPGSKITVARIPVLLSAYAVPCSKVGPGFIDNNFRRILHTEHDGWSRLYGIPLGSGKLSIGDGVSVRI